MAQEAVSELERVPGRSWTVRLDAVGRGSTQVRVSCSRPACPEQRHPTAAAGRAGAIAHIKAHLRAVGSPRSQAYCACRAQDCRTHLPDTPAQRGRGEAWRCGGPVVLAVLTDRQGRWWQVLECCTRCAAATPGARTVATSTAPPAPRAEGGGSRSDASAIAPQFSDQPTDGTGSVPAPRPAAARSTAARSEPVRRRTEQKTIAQRVIPHDLQPAALRDELVELGDLFRSYQELPAPDLAHLAGLHERKARAFRTWADVSGIESLRRDARRAEQAAEAALFQHQQRTGGITVTDTHDGPRTDRLLPVPAHWEHVRAVLTHVADHTPIPEAQARLLVLLLTLRCAHTGTGNVVGQDITTLGLDEPEELIERLTGRGWLALPGTVADLLASRPETATLVTVPSLIPQEGREPTLTFSKKLRPKLSGWVQKVLADKKLRKKKATAATRLLALTLATHSDMSGTLGPGGQGIDLSRLAVHVPVDADELQGLVDQLTAADWLTEAALTDIHLTGQISERILPLTCPLPSAPLPQMP